VINLSLPVLSRATSFAKVVPFGDDWQRRCHVEVSGMRWRMERDFSQKTDGSRAIPMKEGALSTSDADEHIMTR